MAEGEGADGSGHGNAAGGGGAGAAGGPNVRGGPASGATRLTDSNSKSGSDSQSCQC